MRNQAPIPKAQKKPPRFGRFTIKHRKLAALATVALVIVLFVSIGKYHAYLNKFSDKDFAAVSAAAENVMKGVGANDIAKDEECHYRAPGKYDSVRLYCRVEIVAYLPYENDQHAISIAKGLESEVTSLGHTTSHMNDFYENPRDMLTGVSVTFDPPLPEKQCSFTIASNQSAESLVDFLPKKDNDNLIAMRFQCSAESREEYFPVTYRQG